MKFWQRKKMLVISPASPGGNQAARGMASEWRPFLRHSIGRPVIYWRGAKESPTEKYRASRAEK